ncbi:MAG: hypothetical protein JSS23_03155 [Proteobacteria bacterium]|nr:hypothetical protein [Pseudomonadota bacterium]
MQLLIDDQGHAVLREGKPVYKKDDGTEIEFDGAKAFSKIGQLTGENTAYKKRFEEAESKLKAFDGIEDPKKALDALGIVANLDQKKLVDAGEIEKVKGEISKAFQAQLDTATTRAQQLEAQLYAEKVGGAFARSKVIAEKLAIPPDMVEARFGKAFSIEDGRIVAKDANGNKLYSASNPGELAGFDEALGVLVEQYPYKDQILKGTGASGSGAAGNAGGGQGKPAGNFGGTRDDRVAAIASKFNLPKG